MSLDPQINLEIANPTITDSVDFPSAGLPTFTDCASSTASQPSVSTANLGSSSSVSFIRAVFPRVNSFSIAKLCNNSSIIAVSSQVQNLLSLPSTTDTEELKRRSTSRIYLLSSAIDNKYASATRKAVVINPLSSSSSSSVGEDCSSESSFYIQIDEDLFADTSLSSIWVIDGNLAHSILTIVSRHSPNIWKVRSNDNIGQLGDCFQFVAYGNDQYGSPVSLAELSPLPYIEVDEGIVPASRPQIAARSDDAPDSDKFVYVIAEAPVNGVYQLFFYSLKIGNSYTTSSVFGWKQLTFDGENKNAKIKMDSIGNLHVTWESSRCQPSQIYYGVIGPSSRLINNNTFASIVDKQISVDFDIIEGNWLSQAQYNGNVEWLNSRENLPAGRYRLEYLSGAAKDDSGWFASVSVVTDDGVSISEISDIETEYFSTLDECETATINTSVEFDHSGGTIGLKLKDTDYTDNTFSNLFYKIKAVSLNEQAKGLGFSLLKNNPIRSLNLRDVDEYGVYYGDFWSEVTVGGTVSLIDDNSFTVSGNPQSEKFAVVGVLEKDQDNVYFSEDFSQLSYQVSFDLTLNAEVESLTENDIKNSFNEFKQQFSPVAGSENENLYIQDNKRYSIDKPQISFETIIPIVGSFKDDIINERGNYSQQLKHLMLVAIPEKARFIAKSVENESDIVEEYLTGYFKLGMVFDTSSNLSNSKNSAQKNHWIRRFGELYKFNENNSYKIAVHYSHQRKEAEDFTSFSNTNFGTPEQVRFNGDVIVIVNDATVSAETFATDFVGSSFNIGFGCVTVGELKTLLMSAYEASVNENLEVEMEFTNVAIGPHSVVFNDYVCGFAKTDRNVDSMLVVSSASQDESLNISQEAFLTEEEYKLSLGLDRQKFGLTQIPITLVGENIYPSMDIDSCGRAHIAFQSIRDGNWEIYYTGGSDVGFPFRFDTRISDSDFNDLCPTIAIDSNGRKVIAWHSDRFGQYQILTARSHETNSCYNNCDRFVADMYGESEDLYYDEYDPYIYDNERFGNNCSIKFSFQNQNLETKKYHFRVNFYTDENLTDFHSEADSRLDISNWTADGSQLPYDGVSLEANESATVEFYPSSENNLSGVFYAEIEADDGESILPLNKVMVYFCRTKQSPKCSIPVVFTNNALTTATVNFRITFYRDSDLTEVIYSTNTVSNKTRWIKGEEGFPSSGLRVDAGETIAVAYNPEILPPKLFSERDQSNTASLVCGVTYWVYVEALLGGGDIDELDTFAFQCPCEEIDTEIWREPKEENNWICSANGKFDIRLTNTDSHALFPNAAASTDGFIYITWEDRRLETGNFNNNHYIYYALWDASVDKFYSSGQGYRDVEISTYSKFQPQILINNTLHPVFFFTDGQSIYNKICSLYREPQLSSSSSSSLNYGLYPENTITIPSVDSECLFVSVYKEDIAELYHYDIDTPIPMVDDCFVRLEIKSSPNTYALRLRNEDENSWSDWISVLPSLPRHSSSSSAISYEQFISAYKISGDKIILPWVLSRGNGTKTIYCQAMTPMGITSQFSGKILARYKSLSYTVNFYRDAGLTKSVGSYRDVPVIGLPNIAVDAQDITTLLSSTSSTSDVYFKVKFDDNDRLQKIFEVTRTSKFAGLGISFDLYTQGFNSLNQPMSSTSSGEYVGHFTINQNNGLEFKDGLALIKINTPSPCESLLSSSSAFCSYVNKTPEEIKSSLVANLAPVDLEKFKLKYTPDLLCSFMSKACADEREPDITESVDDLNSPIDPSVPVTCQVINWTSPQLGEVGFYKNGSAENSSNWAIVSEVFELDFSNPDTDYIKFNTSLTSIDDVLLIIPATSSITSLPSSSSSVTSSVEFKLPQGTIIFSATEGYYCHKGDLCNIGSVRKDFTIGGVNIGTIPAGTNGNNGTGDYTIFTVPSAIGRLSSSSSSVHSTLALKTNIEISVSKDELQYRGYITENGILRFKLVHIISGVGFAEIYGLTCGTMCNL